MKIPGPGATKARDIRAFGSMSMTMAVDLKPPEDAQSVHGAKVWFESATNQIVVMPLVSSPRVIKFSAEGGVIDGVRMQIVGGRLVVSNSGGGIANSS